jgi:hypothetical protein
VPHLALTGKGKLSRAFAGCAGRCFLNLRLRIANYISTVLGSFPENWSKNKKCITPNPLMQVHVLLKLHVKLEIVAARYASEVAPLLDFFVWRWGHSFQQKASGF